MMLEKRGFKVLIGGGFRSSIHFSTKLLMSFTGKSISTFVEATIRVFDRYGERVSRHIRLVLNI